MKTQNFGIVVQILIITFLTYLGIDMLLRLMLVFLGI